MKISAGPLEALLYKLSHPDTGFNKALLGVADYYHIKPFALRFPDTIYSHGTLNVVIARMSPAQMVTYGASDNNKLAMYVNQADNTNSEKPRNFAGRVSISLDFHLQWRSGDTKQLFEPYLLAVEDAVAEVVQALNVQVWGDGVTYDGTFSVPRSALEVPEDGNGSYRQMIKFVLGFDVSV